MKNKNQIIEVSGENFGTDIQNLKQLHLTAVSLLRTIVDEWADSEDNDPRFKKVYSMPLFSSWVEEIASQEFSGKLK